MIMLNNGQKIAMSAGAVIGGTIAFIRAWRRNKALRSVIDEIIEADKMAAEIENNEAAVTEEKSTGMKAAIDEVVAGNESFRESINQEKEKVEKVDDVVLGGEYSRGCCDEF